jgi:hypothetical protein
MASEFSYCSAQGFLLTEPLFSAPYPWLDIREGVADLSHNALGLCLLPPYILTKPVQSVSVW